MELRAYAFVFLFLLTNTSSKGQQSNFFYQLTTANGLSSNNTAAVIQDKEGFYWIATTEGLNRFDGSTCTVYQNHKNDEHSLSHNNCIFLLEDDNGDIWVATQGGINRFDKRKSTFERFYLDNPSVPFEKLNWIRGMVKDDKGNIYIASYGMWKYNIHTKLWSVYLHKEKDPASPPPGLLFSLQYDEAHSRIWMASEKGYVIFNIANNSFNHSGNNPRHIALCSKSCGGEAIVLDTKGLLWFKDCENNKLSSYNPENNSILATSLSIDRGFFKLSVDDKQRIWIYHWNWPTILYDPLSNTVNSKFLTYHHPRSALDSMAYDLYIDNEKNYWISTKKGVSIYNDQEQLVHYYVLKDENALQNVKINSVVESDSDILWIATNKGLYEYKSIAEKSSNINAIATPLHCMALVEGKQLWLGANNELFCFDISSRKVINKIAMPGHVQFIKPDKMNNIWVGTWESGLYLFSKEMRIVKQFTQGDRPGDLFSNALVGISASSGDHLWLGYNGGNGFSKFESASGTWQHYKVESNKSVKNNSNTVSSITEDSRHNVWLGTSGGGLSSFDPRHKTFNLFMQSDGLKGGYVNSTITDDSGRIWVSTNNGISVIEPKTGQITNPDVDLAMPDNDFVDNGIKRKNHHLLFFAGNMLAEINANDFFTVSKPYRILLSSFKVFNKELPLDEKDKRAITLEHSQNFFSIEYSLLKPFVSVPVQYAYRLKGFDDDWNYVKERRTAYFTNVPPGVYTFLVKATDASGNWTYYSEAVVITIVPPVWLQKWFIILASLIVIFGLYLIYRYRIHQIQKVYRLRAGISQDLHDEVASTLSGIHLYSEMAKQQLESKDYVKGYSSLQVISENSVSMMQGMSDIVWSINPMNDSFKKLFQKLKSYAVQITHPVKIGFVMTVDDSIPSEKLNMQQRRNIYLICKEAINNAVKYSYASQLTIIADRKGPNVEIIIRDDGIGFTGDIEKGNGLLNMELRAKEIGADFQIESGTNKGTVIKILMKF